MKILFAETFLRNSKNKNAGEIHPPPITIGLTKMVENILGDYSKFKKSKNYKKYVLDE